MSFIALLFAGSLYGLILKSDFM